MRSPRFLRRLRPRFSLRGLLALITLASLGVGWLAVVVDRARREDRIVARLHKAGCELRFSDEASPSYSIVEARSSYPPDVFDRTSQLQLVQARRLARRPSEARAWPLSELPSSLFNPVVSVYPQGNAIDVQDLARLRSLRSLSILSGPLSEKERSTIGSLRALESLGIILSESNKPVLDAVGGLSSLKRLSIHSMGPGAAELAPLHGMPAVEYLRLKDFGPNERAVASLLATLPALTTLSLKSHEYTGEGFASAPVMPSVRYLSLAGEPITDDGLRQIVRVFPALRALDVTDTKATAEGVAHIARLAELEALVMTYQDILGAGDSLARLPNLRELAISFTDFAPADLRALQRAERLEWLQLEGALVYDEDVDEFRAARPDVTVLW